MRIVAQRVLRASVSVEGELKASIGPGLLSLVGFGPDDGLDCFTLPWWKAMLAKLLGLRIFADSEGNMNLSVTDTGGELLLVSQFTLYADCRKGLRPSFSGAAQPDLAAALFDRLCRDASQLLPGRVQRGVFGAHMAVELTNDGPVTMILDSADFAR